jgi:arylsulfatase
MIEAGQVSNDILHISDLFTTAARVANATDAIPEDRIIDGLDQSSLFLLGSGKSRRDHVFHYSGDKLKAVRYKDMKMVFGDKDFGGFNKPEFFNLKRDIGEKHPQFYDALPFLQPFLDMVQAHEMRRRAFPDRPKQLAVPIGFQELAHIFRPASPAGECVDGHCHQ